MKNFLKFVCVIAMVFSASFASGQGRYDKGDVLLNAGIGLGYYYAGGVPILVSGEFAVNDVISVGPYFGYTSYNYGYFASGYKFSFIDFGVRGSYHFNELFEIRNEKIDVYGGAFLGYVVSTYPREFKDYNIDPYPGRVRLGIHAGIRYFFAESIAGYAELGAGIAPLSLGLTFKL